MPGFVNCLRTDPLGYGGWGRIGGGSAAVLPDLKLGSPFIIDSCVDSAFQRTLHPSASASQETPNHMRALHACTMPAHADSAC